MATMAADFTDLTEKCGKNIEDEKELIRKQIEELKITNAFLQAENDMFDRYISRLDPQDLVSQAEEEKSGGSQKGGAWWHRSRPNASEPLQLLTMEQKLYIAQREVAETGHDKEKTQWRYERVKDNYKASLQEAELRATEIRRAKSVFERKVLQPLKERKLELKDPERVLHYIVDKLKVNQCERFKLKNQALKAQEQKLLQQLHQRKQIGKAKYEVGRDNTRLNRQREEIFLDYSEPGIEHDQDELQLQSVKVQRSLSTHKKKLQDVMSECAELTCDITRRKQMLEKIKKEIKRAEKDYIQAKVVNQHLRQQLSDYEAPDTMTYLEVKNKHRQLTQSIRTWERKVGIAELALKVNSKPGSKQRAVLTPVNSADTAPRTITQNIPVKLPRIAEKDA